MIFILLGLFFGAVGVSLYNDITSCDRFYEKVTECAKTGDLTAKCRKLYLPKECQDFSEDE